MSRSIAPAAAAAAASTLLGELPGASKPRHKLLHPLWESVLADALDDGVVRTIHMQSKASLSSLLAQMAPSKLEVDCLSTRQWAVLLAYLDKICECLGSFDKIAPFQPWVLRHACSADLHLQIVVRPLFVALMAHDPVYCARALEACAGDERLETPVLIFAKDHTRLFFVKCNDLVARPERRLFVLQILTRFLEQQPARLHEIVNTPLLNSLLNILKHARDIPVVSTGLLVVTMLLPGTALSMRPFLGDLHAICKRVSHIWHEGVSLEPGTPEGAAEDELRLRWRIFVRLLYFMFPCSLLRFLRNECSLDPSFKADLVPILEELPFHPDFLDLQEKELAVEHWRAVQPHDIVAAFMDERQYRHPVSQRILAARDGPAAHPDQLPAGTPPGHPDGRVVRIVDSNNLSPRRSTAPGRSPWDAASTISPKQRSFTGPSSPHHSVFASDLSSSAGSQASANPPPSSAAPSQASANPPPPSAAPSLSRSQAQYRSLEGGSQRIRSSSGESSSIFGPPRGRSVSGASAPSSVAASPATPASSLRIAALTAPAARADGASPTGATMHEDLQRMLERYDATTGLTPTGQQINAQQIFHIQNLLEQGLYQDSPDPVDSTAADANDPALLRHKLLLLRNELIFARFLNNHYKSRATYFHSQSMMAVQSENERHALKNKVDIQRSRIAALKDALDASKHELMDHKERHRKWETEIHLKLSKMIEERRFLSEHSIVINEEMASRDVEIQDLKQELDIQTDLVFKLKTRLAEMEEAMAGSKSVADDRFAEFKDEWSQYMVRHYNALKDRQERCADLESESRLREESLTVVQQQLRSANDRNTLLSVEMQRLSADIARLQKELQQRDVEIARCKELMRLQSHTHAQKIKAVEDKYQAIKAITARLQRHISMELVKKEDIEVVRSPVASTGPP